MIFKRLTLDSFGAFQGVAIEFGPGLNLFFGENEEGKSTLIDGLLLGLLGAPANAERRLRYAPLEHERYAATVHCTTAAGHALRLERDFADGHDRFAVRDGGDWVVGRKPGQAVKALGLPSYDLARATVVISGSEVVLATKEDARTVSKAISARVTRDETAISGQQALRRLGERRVLLENKERKALLAEIEDLRHAQGELAEARARGRQLEEAGKQAQERLVVAQDLLASCRPAIEALERLTKAREALDDVSRRHTPAFADLRAIGQKEEEIAMIEREMEDLLPLAAALEGQNLARFRQLVARQEAVAGREGEIARMQTDLALLREKLALYQRAGFTAERQRELDRIDGAVTLAQKNLAEKESALARSKPPGAWSVAGLALAAIAILAGLGAGMAGMWPGWLVALAGAAGGAVVLAHRGWWIERHRSMCEAREKAAKEVEIARAALTACSGGRDLAAWHGELASAQQIVEEIRTTEAHLQAASGRTAQGLEEEAELAALLAAAGCAEIAQYEQKAAAWAELRRRLQAAREVRDSLLRGKSRRDLEEAELALGSEEAAARAALAGAEKHAAGLDPVAVARYREEIAAIDLPALERQAAAAGAARDQHEESGIKRDPWAVETALALAESALAENKRRAEAVRLAMEVLDQAVAEVQGNLLPRIGHRAGELFTRLTGGRYEGLTITSGAEMLEVEPRRAGATLPVRILSSGTADQMYLALRIALAEALQGPDPLPLILDDPFLTFDRPRLGHGFELLLDLGRAGQVIVVTKDELLRDLAVKAGVAVKGLPGKVR